MAARPRAVSTKSGVGVDWRSIELSALCLDPRGIAGTVSDVATDIAEVERLLDQIESGDIEDEALREAAKGLDVLFESLYESNRQTFAALEAVQSQMRAFVEVNSTSRPTVDLRDDPDIAAWPGAALIFALWVKRHHGDNAEQLSIYESLMRAFDESAPPPDLDAIYEREGLVAPSDDELAAFTAGVLPSDGEG